ncbi:hypothetical protein GB881_16790 [Georgenia subflava]|uniref:Major facilitator superfamily (MFS) profile domain-containing protein n=2 Tax=Georgenia subflava TaxID=1622177 RepID=A0A6N7EQ89_9MICO|nr:hypothetical protein [Georgenia subflava]
MRTFVLVGSMAVIAGGLVAAVTGPASLADGSWAAAYLVLVAGVGQVALGVGQAVLAAVVPSGRRRGWELLLYNVANTAVLLGTVIDTVPLVMAGGVILLVALLLFLSGVRRTHAHRWQLVGYRMLLSLLAASIPVGLVLAVLRHG